MGREILKLNGTYELALSPQLSLFGQSKFSKLESYGNLSNGCPKKRGEPCALLHSNTLTAKKL